VQPLQRLADMAFVPADAHVARQAVMAAFGQVHAGVDVEDAAFMPPAPIGAHRPSTTGMRVGVNHTVDTLMGRNELSPNAQHSMNMQVS